ncbi:MAG: hypothetical protein LUF04_15415 [Bacteroides sp.]|nr:hypothetical protein [Bacteroides sp.]
MGTLNIIQAQISKNLLNDHAIFRNFLRNPSTGTTLFKQEDTIEVEMLHLSEEEEISHPDFHNVLLSTNAYLCKNKGTAADFHVMKDICERQIDTLDEEAHTLINVPLYLGLAGTFIGIIFGLKGINFNEFFAQDQNINSLDDLIRGVMIALTASLIGLLLTVGNSAWFYRKAHTQINAQKDQYYDFLQRELMPILSIGVAGSLASLKSVLGHFVDKFGHNLNNYADTAGLLNENLDKQQAVLEEINKLSLVRTSTRIAQIFADLKESSEDLARFRNYQQDLNKTIQQTTAVTTDFKDILQSFKDFNENLVILSNHSQESKQLHQQFKEAIETHFPTRSDYREVWRKEIDELNKDAQRSSEELSKHLQATTEYIRHFVDNNKEFFSGVPQIQQATDQMVEYARLQKGCYTDLKEEINGLRADFKAIQTENLQVNKDLIQAITQLVQSKEKQHGKTE